jgi:hypothetical protein
MTNLYPFIGRWRWEIKIKIAGEEKIKGCSPFSARFTEGRPRGVRWRAGTPAPPPFSVNSEPGTYFHLQKNEDFLRRGPFRAPLLAGQLG